MQQTPQNRHITMPMLSSSGTNISRDRNWRLNEYTFLRDWDWTGNLTPYLKYQLFYRADSPAKVDSVAFSVWYTNTNQWQYVDKYIYTYDISGEYVTQINAYDPNDISPTVPITKTIFIYDNQNRLSYVYDYQLQSMGDVYDLVKRKQFTYGNNSLNRLDIYNFNPDFNETDYEKYEFTNDTQGRIINSLYSTSADSVTWANWHFETITYDALDSSTGMQLIQYLSHDYTSIWESFFIYSCWGFTFTLNNLCLIMHNTWDFNWDGSNWLNTIRLAYSYTPSQQIDMIYAQTFDVGWSNAERILYTYDTNNNLNVINDQYWETATNDWSIVINQEQYTWETFTANEDEVLPQTISKLTAYPNPFADNVNIILRGTGKIQGNIEIYNLKGQFVKKLPADRNPVWDGTDTNNKPVANGLYYIKVDTGNSILTGKCLKLSK